mmetsp:Transcript_69093/g.218538  ORF Transcript_69093/g.218538 Transcript_69093/m.218538 type:complete len:250 (-) Transcript_69093:805-1554(-)
MVSSPSTLSGYPFSSVKYAVGPDQLVAMTGTPIDMASTFGRPHPSPRLGRTKARAALYRRGRTAVGRCLSMTRTSGHPPSGGGPMFSRAHVFICSTKLEVPWYGLVSITSATSSSPENSERNALSRKSQPFLSSHLKMLTSAHPLRPAALGDRNTRFAARPLSAPRSHGRSRGSYFSGSKKSTSTGSGTARSLAGSTPAFAKVPTWNAVGTHTSFMALQRATWVGVRRSVSNIVRPITLQARRLQSGPP